MGHKTTWKYIALLCYVGLTASAIAFHEPWRDEAQAWLLARDLPLGDLLRHIHYEGSPALWHLLLYPFASTGLPMYWMHIIHGCIAISIAWLVLFKAPFPPWLKIGCIFSYFMLWEYAVIARSYSLGVLLLFLIAWHYPNRHASPLRYLLLIALLFNTNVHSIFPAAALSLVYAFEVVSNSKNWRRYVPAGLVLLMGISVSIWQLIPSPDTTNQSLAHIFSWRAPFIAFANAYFPGIPRTAYVTIGLALLIASLHIGLLYKRSRSITAVLIMSYAGLIYLFVFKHTGSVRHHGLLLMLVLFTHWITSQNPSNVKQTTWSRVGEFSLLGCLVLSSFIGFQNYVNEFRHPFSDARATAQFIQSTSYAEYPLIGHPSIKASSLSPYLEGKQIWYADIESFGSYITWNGTYENGRDISVAEALQRAEDAFPGEDMLLILDEALPDSLVQSFRLVYSSPDRVIGYGEERYFLYQAPID